MGPIKDGLTSLLNVLSILFFHLNSGTIHLAHFCEGQYQVIGPSQPIVASVGDDIILPCRVEPAMDAGGMTVEWSRPDLNPRFVHVWHESQDLLDDQYPSYRRRTSLSIDKMKLGDVSLKLSKARISDSGRYKCLVPDLDASSFVDVAISSTSSPVITGIDTNSGKLVLQCESKGWYPEPEVLWLDGEGNLLFTGPIETIRGPDDLYTVSSRVTVEKSNNITCRVQQNLINRTRETHIKVSGNFLMFQYLFAVPVTISVIVAFLCIVAVTALVLWKKNQSKKRNREGSPSCHSATESKLLRKKGKQMQPVEKIKKTDFQKEKVESHKVELKKKKEKLENVEMMIDSLMEQKEELKKLIQQESIQMENIEELMDEYGNQADSLDEQITQKTIDKAQGYLKLKRIMTDNNWSVKKIIQEQQSLQLNVQKLQQRTEAALQIMTEWKEEIESNVEQSRKELEEMQGHRNSPSDRVKSN